MSQDDWVPPDTAPAADLPVHARERLLDMRKRHFFTSDLSISEFLLVREAGFVPLGLVMGCSVYRVRQVVPTYDPYDSRSLLGFELTPLTNALYHSRELAMTRMEEEAQVLGADGIIGVRLHVRMHAFAPDIMEFIAIGTAIRHEHGEHYKNAKGMPFTSDLSGQDFWTLIRAGYRPQGLVMGNCVYFIPPEAITLFTGDARNMEITHYTHGFYDARELAIERLQAEAEDLGATGVVGVEVEEKEHRFRLTGQFGFVGELVELFVLGTAVVPMKEDVEVPVPTLVIPMNE
jgi:uncharacterized protein YbjQ (UPF0145 family)